MGAISEFYAYSYKTSHMFFPKIIITALIILGFFIAVPKLVTTVKNKESLIPKDYHFFVANYDKVKFYGTIICLALYIYTLKIIGFLPSSLTFIFAFNVLFSGTLDKKSLLNSAIITVVSVVGIWYIFGTVFGITLP